MKKQTKAELLKLAARQNEMAEFYYREMVRLEGDLAEARRLLAAPIGTIEFLATEDPAAPRKDMLRWVKDARALIR